MQKRGRVRHDERYRRQAIASMDKGIPRKEHRPNVNTKHHLILINAILLVNFALFDVPRGAKK
jgi:hypothetical protein